MNIHFSFIIRCEEERQKALEVLDGLQWKGKQMKVKVN